MSNTITLNLSGKELSALLNLYTNWDKCRPQSWDARGFLFLVHAVGIKTKFQMLNTLNVLGPVVSDLDWEPIERYSINEIRSSAGLPRIKASFVPKVGRLKPNKTLSIEMRIDEVQHILSQLHYGALTTHEVGTSHKRSLNMMLLLLYHALGIETVDDAAKLYMSSLVSEFSQKGHFAEMVDDVLLHKNMQKREWVFNVAMTLLISTALPDTPQGKAAIEALAPDTAVAMH
ncbi:hypothetical protein [Yoonia sp. R2-816]|uniref:hypothetical protein n=1 Tax=Yoonia sp. R2-816 TaxID=3342638 RepID=UPI00372C6F88